MANYYVLCPNYDVTPMLGMAEDSSCRDAIWQTGRRLDDSDYDLSDLCFEAEGAHLTPFPDFGMDANGCPVFSARLRELLAFDGIDNIDFYPASIIEFGSSDRRPGYLAANIIGLISCMDRPNSTFEEIGERIFYIESLAIEGEKAQDARLFRLEEVPSVILVDEGVKDAVEEAQLTGLHFIPPDRWDGAFGFKP